MKRIGLVLICLCLSGVVFGVLLYFDPPIPWISDRPEGPKQPPPVAQRAAPETPKADPDRVLPVVKAEPEPVLPEVKPDPPQVPDAGSDPKPEDPDNLPKLAGLDEALREKLLPGKSGKKGTGEGNGSGTAGDATSAAKRSVRWKLTFTNKDGAEYLKQLAAMKATLVFPEPPTWGKYKAYSQLNPPSPAGQAFDTSTLAGRLWFVDDEVIDPGKTSAGRLGEALGLRFDAHPPQFIALFPKDIEEELARVEREYRGRKESEIFSTTFRVLVRDGKTSITVIEQVPVRR